MLTMIRSAAWTVLKVAVKFTQVAEMASLRSGINKMAS